MRAAKWVSFGIMILSGAVCLLHYIAPLVISRMLLGEMGAPGIVGIIGGADGPTAVFVSSGSFFGTGFGFGFIAVIVFVLSLICWLFFRLKSKRPVRN